MAKVKKRERSSDAELNNRILTVAKAILNGYSKRSYLLQYISSTYDWGVTDRMIDHYTAEAKKIIRNSYSPEDLSLEKDIALDRLEALFTMNMKIQDYREARNVTIDRVKLLGVYVEKNDITSKGESIKSEIDYSKLSDETLKEIANARKRNK